MNLSRILIGNSTTNSIECPIDNIKIKNIITDPFGSNRMRFHFPDIFNYEYNNNKIIISRNKKNKDLANAKYFYSDGWNNDLTITIIPKKLNLDRENLLHFLPQDYGEIELLNINKEYYKVGIIIPTFGRLNYLEKCINSLMKSDLSECLIIIIDESLTKDMNEDHIKTNEYIKKLDVNFSLIKIFKNKHGNMFDSNLIGLDILGQCCEFLMTIDSDTIHSNNFVEKIINVYNELEQTFNDKPIIVSGFNTSNHEFIDNNNLNYYIKKTIGGCHLCFRQELYWKYIRYTLISNKWDTNIYNLFNKINGLIATTKPSVIDHIGEISSVREGGRHDKSIDFNL